MAPLCRFECLDKAFFSSSGSFKKASHSGNPQTKRKQVENIFNHDSCYSNVAQLTVELQTSYTGSEVIRSISI